MVYTNIFYARNTWLERFVKRLGERMVNWAVTRSWNRRKLLLSDDYVPQMGGAGLKILDKPAVPSTDSNHQYAHRGGTSEGGTGIKDLVQPSKSVIMGTSADLPPATPSRKGTRHRRKAERKIRAKRQRQ